MKMKTFTVKFQNHPDLKMQARNSNSAYGLARKQTGKMPVSVTEAKTDKLWGLVGLIGFSCVMLGSCAVMWGG